VNRYHKNTLLDKIIRRYHFHFSYESLIYIIFDEIQTAIISYGWNIYGDKHKDKYDYILGRYFGFPKCCILSYINDDVSDNEKMYRWKIWPNFDNYFIKKYGQRKQRILCNKCFYKEYELYKRSSK
jgi:hypothetical protein